MKCPKCDFWGYTQRAVNIHYGRVHKQEKESYVPDLVALGIMPRKLTPKESKEVREEVMAMGIDDPDIRFNMAVIKSIEKVRANE